MYNVSIILATQLKFYLPVIACVSSYLILELGLAEGVVYIVALPTFPDIDRSNFHTNARMTLPVILIDFKEHTLSCFYQCLTQRSHCMHTDCIINSNNHSADNKTQKMLVYFRSQQARIQTMPTIFPIHIKSPCGQHLYTQVGVAAVHRDSRAEITRFEPTK